MYFPFLELRKWGKKAAETRRRNCAVLPYSFLRKASLSGIFPSHTNLDAMPPVGRLKYASFQK